MCFPVYLARYCERFCYHVASCMVYIPSLAHALSLAVSFHCCLCVQKGQACCGARTFLLVPTGFAVGLFGSHSSCSSSSCCAGSSSCPEASFWPSLGHSLARLPATQACPSPTLFARWGRARLQSFTQYSRSSHPFAYVNVR